MESRVSAQIHEDKIEGVPQFVSYFQPLLETLRDLGGHARPRQIFDEIRKRYGVPDEFLEQVNANGRPKFENRVAWARLYLIKAGLMNSPKRGVWGLTDQGLTAQITPALAADLFRSAQAGFKGDEDEQEAPGEDIVSDGVNYWFVGAMWDEGDQTDRFVREGIWQNGYDDKFSRLVKEIEPGDRIAIKSTFVRKFGLPFNNNGRSVSVMKIKAIGTVTANRNDGLIVDVDWEKIDPPREWYLYTYRTTIIRARVEEDDMARHLVAFTFDGIEQDFSRFLSKPYWAAQFAETVEPLSEIEAAEDVDGAIESAAETYGSSDIIADGGFLSLKTLDGLIATLSHKKNLIIQGPPGTGKTWLARRVARALMGRSSPPSSQLRSVQFHPSLSYEDFVRGYRPGPNGTLKLTDGIFLQAIEAARAQPDVPHVLVIEEINRGNPSQIFGEMLTLLENTKRSRAEALELTYSNSHGEKIYITENFYIIGTMNIADRSLAIVDLALRRRFAFVTLEPTLNDAWSAWCSDHGVDDETIVEVRNRIARLNTTIAEDRTLGAQFRIGHSFVTPTSLEKIDDSRVWFRDIVITEIGPLLDEYWFDNAARAEEAKEGLLAGL
jgi:5-methylcytosine-specific restriction protein B